MENVVIAAMGRSAVGKFGGSLKDVSTLEMSEFIVREVLERGGISKDLVDGVIFGNVENRSDEYVLPRLVANRVGLREDCDGYVVQRLCASGMQAIHSAMDEIQLGRRGIVFAGGVENMSRYRYAVSGARFGIRMGSTEFADTLAETMVARSDTRLRAAAIVADNIARKYGITREEQEEYAVQSQTHAKNAVDNGYFKDEIIPIEIPSGKGNTAVFDTDEHIRGDLTVEKLSKMKTTFEGGTVTAGTSSGINDGVSGMVLMSETKAIELNIKPAARILSQAAIGCNPDLFGIGPVPATKLALKRAGVALEDVGIFEINEAFAAQTIACIRELGIRRDIVNVNGGAIALGHALGNSGIRIAVTLLNEMARRNIRYGVAALCIGNGMGQATVFERL